MPLRDFFGTPTSPVELQLLSDLAALGWVTLPSTGLGGSKDELLTAPPTVVWVPTSDRYDDPVFPHSVTPASVANNASLTQVHTRWAGVECRIWAIFSNQPNPPTAEDGSATEILLNQVIMALRKVFGASYRLGGGRWEDAIAKDAEDMTYGRGYILQFWVAIPIYDAAGIANQKTLNSLPLTRKVVNPDASTETDLP